MFYNYKDIFPWYQWPWQTLPTALCTLTLVATERTVILQFLTIYAMDINSDKELELPSERPLSVTKGPNIKYFFVEDEGFALNRNILRQFGWSNPNVKKNVYNYRLYTARSHVEIAFGIQNKKGRIFQRTPNVSPYFVVDNVKTCVFLHTTVECIKWNKIRLYEFQLVLFNRLW